MANLTNYAEKKILDHLLGKAAFSMPAGLYLALLRDDPTEAGSLVSEVSGGGYARLDIRAAMSETDPVTGVSVNTVVITFPNPTATWGTVTHVAFMDATTGGNMLDYAPLSVAMTVNAGDPPPRFLQGQLQIQID